MKRNNINFLLMITLLGVSSCGNGSQEDSVETPNGIQLTENGSNEEVRLLDELVINYMKDGGDAKNLSPLKADYQKVTTLAWKLDEGNTNEQSYSVKLSLNNDLSDAMEFKTAECKIELTDLLVGTSYYWKVSTESGLYSVTGSFSTEDYTPRYINVGGMGNVRDLGGWTTADGNKIVQRIIYRGTEMNNTYNIDEAGIKTMKECLKIKTDIDLRTNIEADNITESPLGSDVNYVHVPTFDGYTNVTNNKQKANYKQVFQTLANKDSYPVYFHCYLGADRTGTLATILEGLVGGIR